MLVIVCQLRRAPPPGCESETASGRRSIEQSGIRHHVTYVKIYLYCICIILIICYIIYM